ncbi:TniB family NTP-binding protein [Micromonospora chalcea]|uniref:TniB family NTP-binding protein n=1 Tax=Micromonospora chalcea TaxID=1874 RepID=UPI003817EB5D
MRAERLIGYFGAAESVERLEDLLAWPARQRMPHCSCTERAGRPPAAVGRE